MAGTNYLVMPLTKMTTVANKLGFPGCQCINVEWLARRRDVC